MIRRLVRRLTAHSVVLHGRKVWYRPTDDLDIIELVEPVDGAEGGRLLPGLVRGSFLADFLRPPRS